VAGEEVFHRPCAEFCAARAPVDFLDLAGSAASSPSRMASSSRRTAEEIVVIWPVAKSSGSDRRIAVRASASDMSFISCPRQIVQASIQTRRRGPAAAATTAPVSNSPSTVSPSAP
jgi:hypothetical protein